ncbi:Uncharacterised protein [uncultured Roseburia sp.]|uniref:Uncharacterized protein n=1 Tax=Brotonthovivens ammoniilytica TaxID=2981725 RepID=A0ABT2TLF5_9FIRM|nr:hypothetical protein [Brotonthovivens ammoniilytica]MCU6763043.1 hypothetical protein [Brotonthovivens ammoniilytica]SCJ01419.1 Uncharacterised protein [uncultured Roseburia sp.]
MKRKSAGRVCGVLAVCLIAGILTVFCQEHKKQNFTKADTGPVSSLETFTGNIYDLSRMVHKDISRQAEISKGKGKQESRFDKILSASRQKSSSGAWCYVLSDGIFGERYYEKENFYAVGWRFTEKNGERDWYFFDEETGFMVKDTVVDGAVISEQGYASAVCASDMQSLNNVQDSVHCGEVLLIDQINCDSEVKIKKDTLFVTLSGSSQKIAPQENRYEMECVLNVQDARLCIGTGVQIDQKGCAQSAVRLSEGGVFDCYGTVGDLTGKGMKYGIQALSSNADICLYQGSSVVGNAVGIYSLGRTLISGGTITLNGQKKADETVSGSEKISGSRAHGIEQKGGTLTMTGGAVWNNGRLGSDTESGSLGGGIFLYQSAVMNMSGGVIAANRAAAGGGIYVDKGCKLTVTGGRIGGSTGCYESSDKNTSACGNYARENRTTGKKKQYRLGAGGGIYSLGTVVLEGKKKIRIDYNTSKGAAGGGGINAASGKLFMEGTISVSSNRADSSRGVQVSELYGGGDSNGEGGGIRMGQEASGVYAECYVNCDDTKEHNQRTGNIQISSNTASGDGGGIFESSAEKNMLYIKGSVKVQNNRSLENGGGGIKSLGGRLHVEGAVVSGNRAENGNHGGGIITAGKTVIRNCQVYQNRSEKEGGGICFYKSTAGTCGTGSILDTAIYENGSKSGGDGITVRGSASVTVGSGTSIYKNYGKGQGIRCGKGSRLYLWGSAVVKRGNTVFLDPGCAIEITGKLTSTEEPVAVLDTDKGSDRRPGRVLVRTAYPEGSGADTLYDKKDHMRFELAFSHTDTGAEAKLRDGSRVSGRIAGTISDKDIYLSESYLISYDTGSRQIPGAVDDDILLSVYSQEKYWMEPVVLDLKEPQILNPDIRAAGWEFSFWEGSNHRIYSETKAEYDTNKSLTLTARWSEEHVSVLEAWLYNHTGWLRGLMKGQKTDVVYRTFSAGDTGIIVFRCRNLKQVRIVWPDTGSSKELKYYDEQEKLLKDAVYGTSDLESNLEETFVTGSYLFQVPLKAEKGTYQVTVEGWTKDNRKIEVPLELSVGSERITSDFRTRLR